MINSQTKKTNNMKSERTYFVKQAFASTRTGKILTYIEVALFIALICAIVAFPLTLILGGYKDFFNHYFLVSGPAVLLFIFIGLTFNFTVSPTPIFIWRFFRPDEEKVKNCIYDSINGIRDEIKDNSNEINELALTIDEKIKDCAEEMRSENLALIEELTDANKSLQTRIEELETIM